MDQIRTVVQSGPCRYRGTAWSYLGHAGGPKTSTPIAQIVHRTCEIAVGNVIVPLPLLNSVRLPHPDIIDADASVPLHRGGRAATYADGYLPDSAQVHTVEVVQGNSSFCPSHRVYGRRIRVDHSSRLAFDSKGCNTSVPRIPLPCTSQ